MASDTRLALLSNLSMLRPFSCNTCTFLLVLLMSLLTVLVSYWLASISLANQAPQMTSSSSKSLSAVKIGRMYPPEFDVPKYSHDNEVVMIGLAERRAEQATENRAEALATINLAETFRNEGNLPKAKRLYQHAVALAPTCAEVLAQFALFMEQFQMDVVRAEHLYTRALAFSPGHELALNGRSRTSPLVADIDNSMMQMLDHKRDSLLSVVPTHESAFRRLKIEAYFQHVYHTVAIEGNTMNLEQTRSILETKLAVGGKSVVEHNEILGMDNALRYLDANIVGRGDELSMYDVLELHRRVLGLVDPDMAGRYRETQVYVGSFEPPPPAQVRANMVELLDWYNKRVDGSRPHPVELAALLHYKFVFIHPFVDGNGRVARLLMNLALMEAGFPPVIVRMADRLEYYETLKLANDGDLRPFMRFVANCTDRTLEEYLNLLTTSPLPEQPTSKIEEITSGIDDDEFDSIIHSEL